MEELDRWISPRWLEAGAQRNVRAEAERTEERLIALDDFLLPAKATELGRFLDEDARFEPQFRDYPPDEPGAGIAGVAEPLISCLKWTGIRRGHELTPNTLRYLLFRKLVIGLPFRGLLGTLTGFPVGEPGRKLSMRRYRYPDHFLNLHTDLMPRPILRWVYYCAPEWRPDYGGRFQLLDNATGRVIREVAPRFNRLLIFSPTPATAHRMEPLREAARDWSRDNYTVWYHEIG